jgi:DNA-binding response OmpR family regulator
MNWAAGSGNFLLMMCPNPFGYDRRDMSAKNILVVEDEASIAEVVSLYLKRAGFTVQIASDGKQAMNIFERQMPDFVILDLMLPEVDGLSLTRWLRDRSDVPIIMLTARREEIDRIAGLEMGADDYVVKPFSPQELVSRVRAVIRRLGREQVEVTNERSLSFSGLNIDPMSRVVTVKETPVDLTAKEFDMLFLLARHPKQVFTREQLLERVWGGAQYIDPGTVTVHVRRLREKIEDDPSSPARLLTVWGVGYKFEP